MIKILSIGNSFSQDSHRYFHAVAENLGKEILTYNLFVGGCSFEMHWSYYVSDEAKYVFEKNGVLANGRDDKRISLKKALAFEDWDIITVQQVSQYSGIEESYYPFIKNLLSVVRDACPKAKLYLHQGWAYEYCRQYSLFEKFYNSSPALMQSAVHKVTEKVACENALEIIPTGDVVYAAINDETVFNSQKGGISLYRDSLHMSLGYGRYLAALVWCKTLLGAKIENCTYVPEDEKTEPALLEFLKMKAVQMLAK